jgi:hypothetical protein
VAVADFDGDAVAEIYVANDMAPSFLLKRNSGDPTGMPLYMNVADAAGCAVGGDGKNEASMGVTCADFDSDGLVDIFLTHYYQAKNTLYRNLGSLLFEDDSYRSRTAAASYNYLGFGTVAVDYDLDEDRDLFIANGHVLGPEQFPNEMLPVLLENDGRAVFRDIASFNGGYFAGKYLGRGVAGGDFDNDGRLDIAVSHLDRPLAVLRNESLTSHRFIGLALLASNRIHPAGGRVTVTVGPHSRTWPIVWGESYLSSGDSRLLIGLGDHSGPAEIRVVWPGGQEQTYSGLETDRYWLLPQNESARLPAAGRIERRS